MIRWPYIGRQILPSCFHTTYIPPPWKDSYPIPFGFRSILRKNCSRQMLVTKKARLPPTAHVIGPSERYIHRSPSHWQFWLLRIILSTFVPSDTGNMNPAWVINRTPCRNWYAENNIVNATLINWTVNNLLSAPRDNALNISQSLPVIKVSKLNTVVARNVCAVMAFRNVWTAYSHPSVFRTCRAQSSLVSAW